MPVKLLERFNPPSLICGGGFGNAILTVFTAGTERREVGSVSWNPAHTSDRQLLTRFVQLPVVDKTEHPHAVGHLFSCENLQRIVNKSRQYNSDIFKYIDVQHIKAIKQERNVCALHIRLGDFRFYGTDYYVPTSEYIREACRYLPGHIDTLKVISNGSRQEVDALIEGAGCMDDYKFVYCSNDEARPDVVLTDMLSCGSIIRTGSTLSLCAVIMKLFDTIVYSVNNISPYCSEKVKIDLPGAHAIIVS